MLHQAFAICYRALSRLFFGVLLVIVGGFMMTPASASAATPPKAEQRPYTVPAAFGERQDPWYWLRDDSRENAQMIAYLEAENAYLQAVMQPQQALQETLYQEIIGRLKQDDASVPYRKNGYWYYQRYETGKQYPIYARRKGDLDAPDRRAGFHGGPFELPGCTILELQVQGLRVVVVHELQRLAGGQGVEAAKDQRVTLARRDAPQVECDVGLDEGGSHGRTFQARSGHRAAHVGALGCGERKRKRSA